MGDTIWQLREYEESIPSSIIASVEKVSPPWAVPLGKKEQGCDCWLFPAGDSRGAGVPAVLNVDTRLVTRDTN